MPPPGYRKHVLAAMPGTPKALLEKTGLAPRTVTGLITKLRASGECHVADWQRSPAGGSFMPIYAAGPGVDAVCRLKPYTTKQLYQRYWKRVGKDEDRREAKRKADAARYYSNKARTKGDPLVGALFGRAP